ncbi:GfdT [Paracoccus sp. S-4012]|uniref:FIST N-terminal domain-containing protein n=1 Tax=Paracoccus sp. S-4012 TaxID=2665648 RepID=UPI0012AFC67F|nr:FIST N-terminal domain-containing protein [Paracoccus sp. S-4012]MRX51554.1 GfdT [Paracoccus sp. S-4012]
MSLPADLAPEAAAAQLAGFAAASDPSLLLLFASPAGVLGPIASALMPILPPGCRVAGCSTAGELVPQGYSDRSVVAVAFPRAGFAVEMVRLELLGRSQVTRWMADIRSAADRLKVRGCGAMFGLVVADGLTRREDVLAATLDAALPGAPVIGGFAGNGLQFAGVEVLADGEVTTDTAVLCLLATDRPVEELVFAHFSSTGRRGVVTAADPAGHAIHEINAEPAAAEYARLAGLDPARLTPLEFARHPLLLRVGRRHHVRSISGVRADGGLQLLASIEVGTLLTLGRAEDLIEGFAKALAGLPRPPELVLGFDCILRRLALEQAGYEKEVARLHSRYNICGFNTYGELHDGMHVNQTFVGIAFLGAD